MSPCTYFRFGLLFVGLLCSFSWTPAAQAQGAPAKSAEEGGPQAVKMMTSDGVTLVGDLFHPELTTSAEQRGGILFLHEPNRSRRDWAYMAQKMARKGFTSFCLLYTSDAADE